VLFVLVIPAGLNSFMHLVFSFTKQLFSLGSMAAHIVLIGGLSALQILDGKLNLFMCGV